MRAALRAEIGRTLRFAVVGASVAAAYAAGYAGLRWLGAAPWAASVPAFAAAVAWQYLAQTLWTFRAPLGESVRALRFAVTIGAGLAVSVAVTGWLGPAAGLAEAGAVAAVVLWLPVQNYLMFRLWVYRDAVAAGRGEPGR